MYGARDMTNVKQGCSWVFRGVELFPCLELRPWSASHPPGCQSAFSKCLSLVLDCAKVSVSYLTPCTPTEACLLMNTKLLFLMDRYEQRMSYLAILHISLCYVFCCCCFLFVCFCLFRATLVAYGGYQARGPLIAVATGLCHSHSNTRSELHL